MPHETLKVEVMNPVKILYEGDATSVSSINEKGPFDILYNHAPFVSKIKEQVRVQVNKEKILVFQLERGVIRCEGNEVKVYVGI